MLILERRCGDGQLRSAMDYLSKKEDEEENEIEGSESLAEVTETKEEASE